MVEGFLVRTVAQVVAEPCIEFLMVSFCVGIDLIGCGFQCFKMCRRVAITEGVIRDDGEAFFQEVFEIEIHEGGNFKF
jgi:hypothetical protein